MVCPHPARQVSGLSARAGKTRLYRALVDAARGAGRVVAGVFLPEVFAEGEKTAIDLSDLATGKTRRLAERVRAPAPGQPEQSQQAMERFE